MPCLRRCNLLALGVGGVLISPESTNAAPENRKMVGSMFVCEAESLEELVFVSSNDIIYLIREIHQSETES